MKRLAAIGVLGALAVAAASGASASPAALTPCKARALVGTFEVLPGSPAAGNIVYVLRLQNTSRATCFVTGIPGVVLLDSHGKALPTHASPTFPGALTAVLVRLAPGKTARATARFSPDVPGVGEQHPGPCEKKAYKLRVTINGGGDLFAPITPPTAVCSQGSMKFTALSAG